MLTPNAAISSTAWLIRVAGCEHHPFFPEQFGRGGEMVKIILIDDNRSTGVLLKMILEQETFQVSLVADERDAIASYKVCSAHLMMINQTCRQCSGWTIFNDIKRIDGEMPLMLYFLKDCRPSDTDWIILAVREALFRRDTGRPEKAFVLPPERNTAYESVTSLLAKQNVRRHGY